ncbi:hypothetical protein [Sulfurovum sp.]|uniref:hypothetical protein n=1 Tax=Sulfurovum sp. TaxID=1969726 RepID=UPI0028680BB3|nr:hypothetical protein [Sulfurovum sp.]
MIRKKLRQIGAIATLSSALLFTNCTAGDQDFVAGAVLGAIAGGVVLSSYNSPHYYDNRPYYYYNNRYYYGGDYRDGYYVYRGQRFRSGHYYNHGYRYYDGRRYPVRVGAYGYYENQEQYGNRYYVQERESRREEAERAYDREEAERAYDREENDRAYDREESYREYDGYDR